MPTHTSPVNSNFSCHTSRSQGMQKVMLGGTGGADDIGATRLGDLGGEMADAVGRRADEDALPGLDIGGVDERLVGGQGREGERVDTRGLVDEGASGAVTYSAWEPTPWG